MKKAILLSTLLLSSYFSLSQAIAYPATFDTYAVSDCIDLTTLNSIVKGHQLDFEVAYFSTLIDAQNNVSELSPFYSYSSFDETLYARVTNNNLSSDFATSEILISLSTLPCCPPPPPGYNSYVFCDTNNDGVEVAYLENLRYIIGYGYPPDSLCDLDESEINITYHLSQSDADNNTNPISEVYTFSENTEIYYKTSSTVSTDTYIAQFGIRIENCTSVDTDSDGLEDYDEDVNRNGNYFDDDTDGDGLKNYEDPDDDNDLILTINEDYNSNGNPSDDDTNGNNIPDYLEFNVTLSISEVDVVGFELLENPVINSLKILFSDISKKKQILIFDVNGKIINELHTFYSVINHDISTLESGIYFISAEIGNKTITKKFIKN